MVDINNLLTVDNVDFIDSSDEFETYVGNEEDIQLLSLFYECLSSFIFEKDFDSFLVCLVSKIRKDKILYTLSSLVDINDARMKSFLNLVDDMFPNFQFDYLHLPSTLDRVTQFIVDMIDLKLNIKIKE